MPRFSSLDATLWAKAAVGDLLVSFGDAPVVDRRELETLMRVFHAGDMVAVVRGSELLDAKGAL
jgi:bifunctional N-acetylglucosamine-1-phosphate-uridyltransferase/glucosamine-1-phosphate-acetyltransferase GlmU-like protein